MKEEGQGDRSRLRPTGRNSRSEANGLREQRNSSANPVGRALRCAPQSQSNDPSRCCANAAGDGTPALPVNDDMNLWDDERIVAEASSSACKFAAYALSQVTMGRTEADRLWRPLNRLIGWCLAYKDKIHFSISDELSKEIGDIFNDTDK